MTCLLVPSPSIIDQSFPRTKAILNAARIALVRAWELSEVGELRLVLTPKMIDLANPALWEWEGAAPEVIEVYAHLQNFLLGVGGSLVLVEGLPTNAGHPVPACAGDDALFTKEWAQEVASVAALQASLGGEPFIGVMCAFGMAGESVCTYDGPASAGQLALVGEDLTGLGTEWEWQIDPDLLRRGVSFNDALRNIPLLGGEARTGTSGSHIPIDFDGGRRPWVLDPNDDPVPEAYVKELVGILGLSYPCIKTVLLTGAFPAQVSRIDGKLRPVPQL